MAIAFAQVKYLSRSKALQATAAAAYRSCSKVYDERTGLTFDYTKKQSPLLYSEIILPENADSKFKDREYLWNKVEHAETRINSQVAKEIILALPKDDVISNDEKIELSRRFAINHFVNKGVAVDINIHNEEENPHAHILVTTRRIIGNQFDSHKARDLNPKVIRGQVQSDRIWGDEWRHFQNNYFLSQGLDLTVDANVIISQIHLGKHAYHTKDKEQLDIWQINESYKNEAKHIALTDPESVLNQLTVHHAVFTEHDIARLLNKHISDPQEFQSALIETKVSKHLISLGQGDDGKERFTTRNMFELENKLQNFALKLEKQSFHPIEKKLIQGTLDYYKLNSEQANAIRHISDARDIAIIVGRAGTGKTYALRAAKEIFEKAGYNVQGIALSGIAAQGLKESSGISCKTIASFTYGLRKGSITLNKQDVVILDEAGMVDNYSLAEIIENISKAQAKIILVGDHDQLQPIGPGAPFRALLEQVGFAELNTILRQEQQWQRQATHDFATGKVKEALNSYHENGSIHFANTEKDAMRQLIDDWHKKYTNDNLNLNQVLILAHRNTDVLQLNQIARAKRILANEIDQGVLIHRNENREFYLSQGDQVLFLKNDNVLDVKNGQFGTVMQIEQDGPCNVKQIVVKLDNAKTVNFDPEKYHHFNHGYSATVHKTQGATIDHSFIYSGGTFWNRNLPYVAGSRHKKSMNLYVDQKSYTNIDSLTSAMEKDGLKDSALNYPLNFAQRRGLDNESLYERAKKYLLDRLIKMRDYVNEKRHIIRNQSKIYLKDKELISNNQVPDARKSEQGIDEIKLVTIKLEKLLTNLEQAKKERAYYKTHLAKRELEREISHIKKNKKIYHEIKSKNIQLGKK